MSHIGWWLGLIIVVLTAAVALGRALLIRGKAYVESSIDVDRDRLPLDLVFESPFPRLLGHAAVTVSKDRICFRDRATLVTRRLVSHECGHVVSRHRRGFWRFWVRFFWDWIRRKPHDQQREEIDAIAAAPQIEAGTYPGVEASATLTLFP